MNVVRSSSLLFRRTIQCSSSKLFGTAKSGGRQHQQRGFIATNASNGVGFLGCTSNWTTMSAAATTRSVDGSVRSPTLPVSQNSTVIVAGQQHQRRGGSLFLFSTEARSNVLDILAREEAEEHELGNTALPDELADLKATIEQDWRIVEMGALTEMFRTIDHGAKVQLSFHCQDTIEDEGSFDEEEEEEEDEQSSPVRFTVTVSKAGKTITFACYSEYGLAKIDGVSTTHLSPQSVHETMGTLPKVEYQGPVYTELSEDLQEAFETYLQEECGVTEDIAAFVAMFADYREQMNYMSFLKEAQAIIS